MLSRLKLTAGAAILATVAYAGCSSSNTPTNPTPPPPAGAAADVTITIVGMNGAQSYSANPGAVKVGQTVSWRNADSVTHTATSDTGSFNTGSISPGATSAPIKMNTAGSFGYHCSIHPTMVGTLNVQ